MNENLLQKSQRVAAGLISGTEWWFFLAESDSAYADGYAGALAADAAREAAKPAAELERETVYAALIAAGHSEKSARRHAYEAYSEMLLDAAFAAQRAAYAAS